jgi:hypothetical protein
MKRNSSFRLKDHAFLTLATSNAIAAGVPNDLARGFGFEGLFVLLPPFLPVLRTDVFFFFVAMVSSAERL